jgi:serine beta-lactamase-like protein LACTB
LIDIDKPISEYLPDYPQQKDVITTRMLAGHLSGTRHYKGTEFLSNKEYETTHDAMEVFKYVLARIISFPY